MPWALTGSPVVLDSHTHTTFSDGGLSVQDLADLAFVNGCTALAVTDHGDLAVRSATPDYFAAIDAARERHPSMIVLAGLEWNVPPYLGREHATLLVDRALEREVLPEFRTRFEAKGAAAGEALQWLGQRAGGPRNAVLIYNHPSRLDIDPEENDRDYAAWQAQGGLFVGFEGGPGHQKMSSPGDYRGRLPTRDRWDPVVADVGGTWDRQLDAGRAAWGALAVSDFHGEDHDHAPCAFARTHLRVPQRDAPGVLDALRAGTFWAGHGRVLDDLALVAIHPALPVPAAAGETFRLRASAPMPTFRVGLTRAPDAKGRPLEVEIIGNGVSGKPERVAGGTIASDATTFDWTPKALQPGADGRSAYVRARVIAKGDGSERLVAYTNPVRVLLRD